MLTEKLLSQLRQNITAEKRSFSRHRGQQGDLKYCGVDEGLVGGLNGPIRAISSHRLHGPTGCGDAVLRQTGLRELALRVRSIRTLVLQLAAWSAKASDPVWLLRAPFCM
jgi:hypothetical protein